MNLLFVMIVIGLLFVWLNAWLKALLHLLVFLIVLPFKLIASLQKDWEDHKAGKPWYK